MARVGKNMRGGPHGSISQNENLEKPLAATLFQEFQNLKEKFKNEDDEYDAGECLMRRCCGGCDEGVVVSLGCLFNLLFVCLFYL